MATKAKKKVKEKRYAYKNCPEDLNQKIYEKIRQRRKQMLVHSHIYYRMDMNIVTDKQFDRWAYELKQLQTEYPEESEACDLYEEFTDWDGSTGSHLPHLVWVADIAQHLLDWNSKNK